MEHLQQYFGAYRTIKIQFDKDMENFSQDAAKEQSKEITEWISEKFPKSDSTVVSVEEPWIQILFHEEEIHMMDIVNLIQEHRQIVDMNMQEISTESIIRKIYEGGVE